MNIVILTTMAWSIGMTMGLAFLGMFFMAWYNEITNPDKANPDLKKFFQKNANPFIYALITNFLLILILTVAPDFASFLKTVFGLDVTMPIKNGSGVILGIGVYEIIRKRFKLKGVDIDINKKDN